MNENNGLPENNGAVTDTEQKQEEAAVQESLPETFGDSDYTDMPENVGVEKQDKKNSHLPVILLLILICILIAALTVYCIYTDVKGGSVEFNKKSSAGYNSDFSLELNSRPGKGDTEYMDEKGRYTMEGLAKYIRPQIVDVYAFSSSYPKNIISTGSGIILSEDGYIVTNTHILDSTSNLLAKETVKADSCFIITSDGKQYDAVIVGKDTKTDIAVVKIEAAGLSYAELGNSDETVIGEKVAAIGNPEGLSGSITEGIVSAINRNLKTDYKGFAMNFIQTDAAVSPGNSGGALVNMYGQVIGITSAKYSASSSEGLGFAITVNDAEPIIEEIISKGYVSGRKKIGISFYSMDNVQIYELFIEKYKRDMPEKLQGIWVTDISEDCDISNTELKVDDFILSVNGQKVTNYDELNNAIKDNKAGDTVKAECARIDMNLKITYFNIEFKLMNDTSGDY